MDNHDKYTHVGKGVYVTKGKEKDPKAQKYKKEGDKFVKIIKEKPSKEKTTTKTKEPKDNKDIDTNTDVPNKEYDRVINIHKENKIPEDLEPHEKEAVETVETYTVASGKFFGKNAEKEEGIDPEFVKKREIIRKLAEAYIQPPKTIYRGMTFKQQMLDRIKPGQEFPLRFISSFSEDPGIAEDFAFRKGIASGYSHLNEPDDKAVIFRTVSKRGFNINGIGKYPEEKEVLVAGKCKINNVEYDENKKIWWVDVEIT